MNGIAKAARSVVYSVYVTYFELRSSLNLTDLYRFFVDELYMIVVPEYSKMCRAAYCLFSHRF